MVGGCVLVKARSDQGQKERFARAKIDGCRDTTAG